MLLLKIYGPVFAFFKFPSNSLIFIYQLVMTAKNILAGVLSILLFFSACTKEVDELPPATQTGANTFGAKINGKNWVPARFGIIPANNLLEAFYSGPNSIMITARNFSASPTETVLEMQIANIDGPGTYYMNQDFTKPTAASYAYYVKRTITPEDEWQTSTKNNGTVVITRFDQNEKIISGTFEINAGSLYHNGQAISITEGRFDVKFQ